MRELAREDRPVDIFSPSGVLATASQDRNLSVTQNSADAALATRSVLSADQLIPFKQSAGRICAEVITPYPPGIPVISPGEEITKEIIDYLGLEKKAGVRMQGPYDDDLRRIRVVKQI